MKRRMRSLSGIRLYRDTDHGMIMGVCAGLSDQFGFRLGVHRDRWMRFEAEFDEVYTSRDPAGNAARQATLAVHARFEPQSWTLAPSVLAGVAMVMFDAERLRRTVAPRSAA